MSYALVTCATLVLSVTAITVAEPAAEPERMTIRVDPAAILDFGRFLAGLGHLSQKKPVILDLVGAMPPSFLEVGTDASFGHAFPDEPVLLRIGRREIHIGTGPALRTISDEELPQYLKEMVEAASKSKSVAVPILAADRGVRGSRGLTVLHQIRKSGIARIRIP